MRKALKLLGVLLGCLVAVPLSLYAYVCAATSSRAATRYETASSTFEIPTDEASITEGARLYHARSCADCHGEDGGGRVFLDDPAMGRFVGANLTRFALLDAQGWSRAVRDGLRADGTPLVFMPAADVNLMPDRELAAIVAYVRTLPRVDRDLPPRSIGPVGRIVGYFGGIPLFSAAEIDHSRRPDDIPPGRSLEMGHYLSRSCVGCHGEHLSGGPIPGAPPELGLPTNLTFHETGLAGWSEADFAGSLREGRSPGGRTVSAAQMPWEMVTAYFTDDEIGSLYDYLQTLPHRPAGER